MHSVHSACTKSHTGKLTKTKEVFLHANEHCKAAAQGRQARDWHVPASPVRHLGEAEAHAGWDWLNVDMEHGAIDYEMLASMLMAIGTTDTIPTCRVQSNDPVSIKRVLDAGAMGIVVPMVCTPEEARNAVRSAKYPPEGSERGGGRWRFWAGHGDVKDYTDHANDEIAVIVQIEHQDAVKRAEENPLSSGRGCLLHRPNDLAWSMGLGKGLGAKDPRHAEAIQEVLRAAKKVGTLRYSLYECGRSIGAPRAGLSVLRMHERPEHDVRIRAAAVKQIREKWKDHK